MNTPCHKHVCTKTPTTLYCTSGIGNLHVAPYSGIKIFTGSKKAQFKAALNTYLNTHSFYSVEEFLMLKNMSQFL
jgi:hypothetical protein